MTKFALPALSQGEGWQFTIQIHTDQCGGKIKLGAPAPAEAPMQIQLRPDGGFSQTHGVCNRFQPGPDTNLSNFAVMNGSCCISSVMVPFRKGHEYTVRMYPNTGPNMYSVFMSADGGRFVPIAIDYYYTHEAKSDDITDLYTEANEIDFTISPAAVTAPMPADAPRSPKIFFVGPARECTDLQAAAFMVQAGDMVLVDDDYYHKGSLILPFSGEAGLPIIFKGIAKEGKRPVIDGEFEIFAVEASGHYTIFEGFEVKNAAKAGICHHSHKLEIRDCVIHECLMGILSDQDIGMGDCEIDRCELYDNGHEMYSHQIYMATDDARFPGSVIKIHDCHIHDALGGNNIKSRAYRNEIYNNRVTNAFYHNMELIGPDPEFNPMDCTQLPHNSDVWDNYFENSRWYQCRCGGDGTGDSHGTFRFINNTFVSNFNESEEEFRVFRFMFGIRRVEAYGNTFIYQCKRPSSLYRDVNAVWAEGEDCGNRLCGCEPFNTFQDAE